MALLTSFGLVAGTVVAAVVAAPSAFAASSTVCGDTSCTVTYGLSGSPDAFTVPSFVHSLLVTVDGGHGATPRSPTSERWTSAAPAAARSARSR